MRALIDWSGDGEWHETEPSAPLPEPTEPTSNELLRARRDLAADRQRELERAPGWADRINERYTAEDAAIAAQLEAHAESLRVQNYYLRREDADPIATGLMQLLLAAKSDDDVFAMFQDIASRFRAIASPERVEIDWGDQVADIDRNNPARQPAPPPDLAAIRRQHERAAEPRPTHADPLNTIWAAEQKRLRAAATNRRNTR